MRVVVHRGIMFCMTFGGGVPNPNKAEGIRVYQLGDSEEVHQELLRF